MTTVPASPIIRVACLTFAFVLAGTAVLDAADASMKSLRQQAAARLRRIIFNNDGNEPVKDCKTTSPEELLKYRTTALVGRHVDTIFYCTWSSGFSLFTHDTKVGQVFTSSEVMLSNNMTRAMLAAGTDPLRVMVDFGKKHGIEIFWSMRMNDTHDGSTADYGPVLFRANKFKMEHPDCLLGTKENRPKHGSWTAVDYGRAEVRDLAFRLVEEVCRNYDVDGVELDFFRHPVFFKSNSVGQPATDAERAQMTDLMRRIRQMSDEVGRKRGRPLLIAMRVPDSVAYCRAIGLDLERWLADDLLDVMAVASYFQLNEWKYSVELGHKYGVKVYPSLDESRIRDKQSLALRKSLAAFRGRAMNIWHSGADGVYMFNYFKSDSSLWRELGDATTLKTLDRDYFASIRGVGTAAGNSLSHAPFQRIATLNPSAPIKLAAGKTAGVKLLVGEDPADVPQTTKATLRLRFSKLKNAGCIVVTLNGKPLANPRPVGEWLEFSIEPRHVHRGANAVEVALRATVKETALWTDLHLTLIP